MPKTNATNQPPTAVNTGTSRSVDIASRSRYVPTVRSRLPILIAVAIPTVIAISRLPPGICFGDGGDLQLSSVALGIAHPPGYPILSTIGYLLTRVPFVEPAYIITLACALSGAIAAYLCGLIQLRLGVHPLIAAAASVLFLSHPRVWYNVVAPEVYMPAMALLAGTVYYLIEFADSGRRRHFFMATLLFGLTVFTRPPTLFSLPFFLLATILIDRRRRIPGKETAKRTLLGALLIALPGLYSFGFILARDRSDVAYNYIDLHNAESGALPEITAGVWARVERAVWTMTGQQYAQKIGNSWPKIRSKLNWVRNRGFPVELPLLIPILTIALAGTIGTWRRSAPVALVLVGLVFQTVVFLCAYQVHGQEANLLPLLAAIFIFGGVATSITIARLTKQKQTMVAAALASACIGGATVYLTQRPDIRGLFDATRGIVQADIATLPNDSVIISAWGWTTPLRYSYYFANRPDIHIETVSPWRWTEFATKFDGRPVFVPRIDKKLASSFQATQFRNLYLLTPRGVTGND